MRTENVKSEFRLKKGKFHHWKNFIQIIFFYSKKWFMIHHEHWNTYMEWKFKSLRIWPSEKLIVREFRLRHFWKFFWDNNQKSFWDSHQMSKLNYPVHTKVNFEISLCENFPELLTYSPANPWFWLLQWYLFWSWWEVKIVMCYTSSNCDSEWGS